MFGTMKQLAVINHKLDLLLRRQTSLSPEDQAKLNQIFDASKKSAAKLSAFDKDETAPGGTRKPQPMGDF
jgi:hypothetical protein